MKIEFQQYRNKVYNLLNDSTELKNKIQQLLLQTEIQGGNFPVVIVGFPFKGAEEAVEIGYHPMITLIFPITIYSITKNSEGKERTLKEVSEEAYDICSTLEEIARDNKRWIIGSNNVVCLPGESTPVIEKSENLVYFRIETSFNLSFRMAA